MVFWANGFGTNLRWPLGVWLSLALLPLIGFAGETDEADTVRRWAEAERLEVEEKAGWESRQRLVRNAIDVAREELVALRERLTDLNTQSDAAGREVSGLREQRDALREIREELAKVVDGYENRALAMAKYFPAPLREKTAVWLKRVENGRTETASLADRLGAVLRIVESAAAFNESVTLIHEVRQLDSGKKVELRFLYFGLGAGYFVNSAGDFAGIAIPAQNSWRLEPRPELAERVLSAIALHERTRRPAEFVPLPVTIRDFE